MPNDDSTVEHDGSLGHCSAPFGRCNGMATARVAPTVIPVYAPAAINQDVGATLAVALKESSTIG